MSVFPVPLFPGQLATYEIGRTRSQAILDAEDTLKDGFVAVHAQIDGLEGELTLDRLHPVGVAAHIEALHKGGSTYVVKLHGQFRVRLIELVQADPFAVAAEELLYDAADVPDRALVEEIRSLTLNLIRAHPKSPPHAERLVLGIKDPTLLADAISPNLEASPTEHLDLMSTLSPTERLQKLRPLLRRELRRLQDEDDGGEGWAR